MKPGQKNNYIFLTASLPRPDLLDFLNIAQFSSLIVKLLDEMITVDKKKKVFHVP